MKLQHSLCAAAIALCAAVQPAMSGNAEEMERCAEAIHASKPATVTVGGFKFKCSSRIIVMSEAEAMQMPGASGNHAYFKGHFAHLNSKLGISLAADVIRFPVVVENWADAQNCRMAEPSIQIERRSRLIRISEYVPNWMDWKSLPRKIDGKWEAAALAIAAASIRKWHQNTEFSRCKRGW